MGGYHSRLDQQRPVQNFAVNEATPARVHFSPELLHQLQQQQQIDQQAKTQAAAKPLRPKILIPEEPPEVQRERLARVAREKEVIAANEEKRQKAKAAEEESIRMAQTSLARIQLRNDEINVYTSNKASKDCPIEVKSLAKILDDGKANQAFQILRTFEDCVRRRD